MISIDWVTLNNWIVSGIIGLVFGVISAWVAYRFQRKRDDIAWNRRLEEMHRQWEHQQSEQAKVQIRKELLRGIDNPDKAIRELKSYLGSVGAGATSKDGVEILLINLVEAIDKQET